MKASGWRLVSLKCTQGNGGRFEGGLQSLLGGNPGPIPSRQSDPLEISSEGPCA